MKKGPKVKFDQYGSGNFQFAIDWRDDPIAVMEVVDAHLKEHGLEIVTHESDADWYGFTIRPIKAKK